ncbi:quinone-dependent dihydroorotate dehydrogenase [Spongorhabdus nitratireducens]
MYRLARNLLFKMPAETAHELTLDLLSAASRLKLASFLNTPVPDQPVEVMGLKFPNPVGLAAGLDKNGDHIDALGELGFGFLELGTVTPRPQPGNPKPRLFRLVEHEAIINRMGFNNMGVDHLVRNVKRSNYRGVLGINIGKNLDTPVEKAVDDYVICLHKVYPVADYVTVNLSSPNTPGLRNLQFGDMLKELLATLKQEQKQLEQKHDRYVPVMIKIAPDMTDEELYEVADALLLAEIDGVVATNTTLERDPVSGHEHACEAGGLSGAPLTEHSTEIVRKLAERLAGKMPVIGVGGIVDGTSAAAKYQAGASLVQIYSGFVFKGPELVGEAVDAITACMKSEVKTDSEVKPEAHKVEQSPEE